MEQSKLLEKTIRKDKTYLNEYESKLLLKEYGIPVIHEIVASNEDEAVEAAQKTGFPVVLKGLGATLLHKTERGLVRLNLADPQAVSTAAYAVAKEAGDELEGLLIQPQVEGKREFTAGLFRDKQFGPVIMFGLGGIFAEAFSDVTFRLAPITETDAKEMLDEIKAKSLLGNFRGEKTADRSRLIQTLLGLSRLAMERLDIAEVDLNPLIINPGGQVCAVDALVVIDTRIKDIKFPPPVDPNALRRFFYPESIAFIGASAKMDKWGHMLFTITVSNGFKGEIYLVNPKGGSIADRQVYKSIAEIPGSVDLAVVTIPATKVIDLLPQLQEKGINNMLLISSGFSETGKSGREMEKELAQKARGAGILIIGPNTMGICNPHINLYCTGTPVLPEAGSVAVAAQSGNMGTQLLAFAQDQGIGIRAFCGSGNEAMVTIEDYIDSFEKDPLTSIVMLYIESVKNGRRFFESARRVGKKKPIVLLKGGQSQAGNKAATSHTGALASDIHIFDAVCRQAGIVKVERSMDLLDLSAAFSSLPLINGNRVAILTMGGGWGVVTADLCSKYGLEVPELSTEILERIDRILPSYWSRSNPIDLVGEMDPSLPMTVIEELCKWDGCDAVINLGILGRRIFIQRRADMVLKADPTYSPGFLDSVVQASSEFEQEYIKHIVTLMQIHHKPVFGVSFVSGKDQVIHCVDDSSFKAVFYQTPERAVKACAKMYEYKRFLAR